MNSQILGESKVRFFGQGPNDILEVFSAARELNPHITEIWFESCMVRHGVLIYIARRKALRSLHFKFTELDNSFLLQYLGKIVQLQRLVLQSPQNQDFQPEVERLCKLHELQMLGLIGLKGLTDDGVLEMPRLISLKRLSLRRSPISDSAFHQLSHAGLEFIDLTGRPETVVPITFETLMEKDWETMPSLRCLRVDEHLMSREEARCFREEHYNIEVVYPKDGA